MPDLPFLAGAPAFPLPFSGSFLFPVSDFLVVTAPKKLSRRPAMQSVRSGPTSYQLSLSREFCCKVHAQSALMHFYWEWAAKTEHICRDSMNDFHLHILGLHMSGGGEHKTMQPRELPLKSAAAHLILVNQKACDKLMNEYEHP